MGESMCNCENCGEQILAGESLYKNGEKHFCQFCVDAGLVVYTSFESLDEFVQTNLPHRMEVRKDWNRKSVTWM